MQRIIDVFDTTLRDGEQSPGVNLSKEEKVQIALQLERLGVNTMEAGFPASSKGEFLAVQQIAEKIEQCTVAGLARSVESDIDAAWEALRKAKQPRLHLFISTSPIHMKYKLGKTPEEVIDLAVRSVRYAAKYFSDIEWSAEDATRTELPFLAKLVEKVIEAGATWINLPDTVGYASPQEYGAMFRYIQEHVPNIHRAKLSAHCHDDLGLAIANTLAAIKAGVDQVECTVNGIGERAGNAALEELLVSLEVRKDIYGVCTGCRLEEITKTSRMVSELTGMVVQPNKAVVGANAFAHESGIHQDGMLKNHQTYEIIQPNMIGLTDRSQSLVLGKHSGRHAFSVRCQELGYRLSKEEVNTLFQQFKELTERKKVITEEDLTALITDYQLQQKGGGQGEKAYHGFAG